MPRTRKKADGEAGFEMRRRPLQERSKSTVAVIKQAALEILGKEGVSACGTDRIAERAGLSIGSLYKYFPNREAILKSMYEDASLEYARAIGKLTLQILDLPTEQGMELTMRKVVTMHENNRLILLRLANEMPELALESQPMAFHNLVRTNIQAYVQHRNRALKPREVAHRCFFIEQIVFSCIQGYVKDTPTGMTHRKFSASMARLISSIIDDA